MTNADLESFEFDKEEVSGQEALEAVLRKSRNQLLGLDRMDDESEGMEEEIKDKLDWIRESLDVLVQIYGVDDPEVLILETLYDDLLGDLERGENVEIDSTYRQLFEDMELIIEEAGVEENPDDLGSSVELVDALDNLGVDYEYVVTAPGNEDTVILFLQLHPNPGMSEEVIKKSGIEQSQLQIEETVRVLVENGISRTVLSEGDPFRKEVTSDFAYSMISRLPEIENMAHYRLARDLGDDINIIGYEDMSLIFSAVRLFAGQGDDSDEAYMSARMITGNVLVGTNMLSLLEEGEVSSVIIGAGHEKSYRSRHPDHMLPLSHVLAALGVNVVVIDTSKELDQTAFDMDEIKKAMADGLGGA